MFTDRYSPSSFGNSALAEALYIHQFRSRSFSVNPAFASYAGQQHSIVTLPPLPGDFLSLTESGDKCQCLPDQSHLVI
jgi:hypothetical protein